MSRQWQFVAVVWLASTFLGGCNSGVQRVDYSVEKLVQTLKDKDPNMRYWAADSLGNYGPQADTSIPALIETLKDDTPMVRMGAAYALGQMGPRAEQARAALTEAAKDSDKEVRQAASYALKRIADKNVSKPAKR